MEKLSPIVALYKNVRFEPCIFGPSGFTPSAHGMYDIIQTMDEWLNTVDEYDFERWNVAWHPLITRLYYGVLFFIQTLRAQRSAGTLSARRSIFLHLFHVAFPPESLPVAGPLVQIFESLNSVDLKDVHEQVITPEIPEIIGPASAKDYGTTAPTANQLILPNIPLLLGFLNMIGTAENIEQIPDFESGAWNHNEARVLLGQHYLPNAWTQPQRDLLLSAGLVYPPTVNENCLKRFYNNYSSFAFPVIADNVNLESMEAYTGLNETMEWFGKCIKVMQFYSKFFRLSRSLNECATESIAPLITTTLSVVNLKSNEPIRSVLTHAFSNDPVMKYEGIHTMTEVEEPDEILREKGFQARLNLLIIPDDLDGWSSIGQTNRYGIYWTTYPKTYAFKSDQFEIDEIRRRIFTDWFSKIPVTQT